MSLILQALKKAKDLASRKAPPARPTALASFRFGRPTRAERLRKIAIFYVLPGIALLAVMGYTVNFWTNRMQAPDGVPALQEHNAAPVADAPPDTSAEITTPEPVASATGRPAQSKQSPLTSRNEEEEEAEPSRPQRPPLTASAPPPELFIEEPAAANPAPGLQVPPAAGNAPVASTPAMPKAQAETPPQIQVTPAAGNSFDLAVFYQQSGDFEQALAHYNVILGREPMNQYVHNNIGLIHQSMQNYPEAIKAFRRAILIDENYDKAHNNLGNALMNEGQNAAAAAAFNRAIALNPRNADAMTNLGILAKKSNNLEQAKSHYLRALQTNVETPQAHYNLAMVYEEQGEIGKAVEHYRKFLQYGAAAFPEVARQVDQKIAELTRRPLGR